MCSRTLIGEETPSQDAKMLSPEERQEIEAELARYPAKQAVTIDALLIVQKHRGWVSDETLKDLAAFLGMTVEDLDGVATFYNLIFHGL